MSTSEQRTRSWIIVINNYTEEQYADLCERLPQLCTYGILAREVGENGTPHIQGYVEFKNTKTMSAAKKVISERAHLEKRQAKPSEASDYCKKDGKFFEFGKLPAQGKRNDLIEVRKTFDETGQIRKVVESGANYNSIRYIEKVATYCEKRRTWKPMVYWFWGDTGTGKTKKALEMFPNAWLSGNTLKWWQGYDAHEDVIIDDFRGNYCTFGELLRILDRTPYRVEFKGGSRELLAKNIVITCPFHPKHVYSTIEDVRQLLRRIDVIEHFGKHVGNLPEGGKWGNIDDEETVIDGIL